MYDLHGIFLSVNFVSLILVLLLLPDDDSELSCVLETDPEDDEDDDDDDVGVGIEDIKVAGISSSRDKIVSSIDKSIGLSGQRGSIKTSPVNIPVE